MAVSRTLLHYLQQGMRLSMIERPYCVFSGKADLEPIADFKHFPIFMGCVDQALERDIFADMCWYISRSTGSIQLNPLVPLEVLYSAPHNEVVGSTWFDHHQQFASFIRKFGVTSALEIGGAHGTLARNYLEHVPQAHWTIVEPNPQIAEEERISIHKGFLDKNFRSARSYDAVVHSHVFEHIYYPSQFLTDLRFQLRPGNMHIFSIPNLHKLLSNCSTNCLNFEHTCFIIEPYLDVLLANHGFEIIEKQHFLEHSIFYATRYGAENPQCPFPNLYQENRRLMNRFVRSIHDAVRDLNQKISGAQHPVYLFGAHIFSQYLICAGLQSEKIVSVLDNGALKIGKRLYGTRFTVDAPKCLANAGRVNVILRAGMYNEEIKRQILGQLNPEVVFWE